MPLNLKCEPMSWTFPYKRDLSTVSALNVCCEAFGYVSFLNMEPSLFVNE